MRRQLVLLTCLCCSVSVAPAWAGDGSVRSGARPAASGEEVEAPEVGEQPDRRRVLALADGRLVRARTRDLGQGWEWREGSRWRPLEGEVRWAREERELVAEAGRMRAALPGEHPLARVGLATWMAEHGLAREALEEFDAILEERPDYEPALEALASSPLELELDPAVPPATPAWVGAVIAKASRGGPATRELGIRALASLGERLDLDSVVRAELVVFPHRRRVFATELARRLRPGQYLTELCDRAILDTSAPVRDAAARTLGAAREVAVLGPMIRALGSENAQVRTNAATAMGAMSYKAAVEPLATHLASLASGSGSSVGVRSSMFLGRQTTYVMDYDVEIAQAAAIADPILGVQASGVSFDVRHNVQITKVIEMRAVVRSLATLTGADPGDGGPDDWLAWWEANASAWRSLDHAGGAGTER